MQGMDGAADNRRTICKNQWPAELWTFNDDV